MATSAQGGEVRVGAWRVRPAEGRLIGPDGEVRLEPKTMAVLVTLAQHVGEVVPKELFLEAVWGGAAVSDEVLTNAIWQLRRALGDDSRRPRFIATVPRRGYRLIAAETVAVGDTGGPPSTAPASSSRSGIAVLPFADLSPAHELLHVCDGIAEEVMLALGRLDGLRVAARTSAFSFRDARERVEEIGRALGVDFVLDGSVRRSRDRLRVAVQLADAREGFQIWSERFDRPAEEVFEIQDAVSLTIANWLQTRLGERTRPLPVRPATPSRQAYELYLRGRHLVHRRHPGDSERALECFRDSIGHDPRFAAPHVAIAEAHVVRAVWGAGEPRQAFWAAESAARRALQLDPDSGEAHLVLAVVEHTHRHDRERAGHHFARSFELGTREPLARIWRALHHLACGRDRLAVEQVEEAVASDPLSPVVLAAAGAAHVGAGEVAAAERWLDAALRLDTELPITHHWRGWCLAARGEDERAIAPLRRAVAAGIPLAAAVLGIVLVRLRRDAEARRQLTSLEAAAGAGYVPWLPRAILHEVLGDSARGHELLVRARDAGEPDLSLSLTGAFLDGLLPAAWVERARELVAPGTAWGRVEVAD